MQRRGERDDARCAGLVGGHRCRALRIGRAVDTFRPVSRWRIWWLAGRGEAPSEELVDAAAGLSGSAVRQARRLVRRGEVAEDVAVARYAVALAHDRQRRKARRPFHRWVALGVVLALTGAGLAADAFARIEDLKGVVFAGIALFFLSCLWRLWQERRNLDEAERANREYLRRAGAPYVPRSAPTGVRVPPLAVACSFVVQVAILIPVAGVITRLLDRQPLSPGNTLSAGAPTAAGFAIALLFALGRGSRTINHRSSDL